MGLQMDIFSSSSSSSSSSSFTPPELVSLRYITFLLGTENAMGGRGSLAVYDILFLLGSVMYDH